MRKFFLSSILLFCHFVPFAQQSDLVFHHLKEADGLSNNFVLSFLKDRRGNLWLGTQNGLNRFDGEHFYTFSRSRNDQTIIDNGIKDLCEDRNGYIWGATNNGIFRFASEGYSFRNYKTPSTRFARVIHNIACDNYGTIWATGEWNIMQYDSVRDVFIDFKPINTSPDSLHDYSVRQKGMLEDPLHRGMWFATRMGLYFYDLQKGRYYDFSGYPQQSGTYHHSFSSLATSSSGGFWAFDNTDKSVVLIDPGQMKITVRISLKPAMKDANGASLFEDTDGRLWFSSWEHGMLMIDRKHGDRIIPLKHDPSDALSIAGDFMWDAYQDADGTIWCGTTGGLSRCNPSKSLFRLYQFGDLDPALRQGHITVIREDERDKSWWIGLIDGKLVHYFPQSNKLEKLDLQKSVRDPQGHLPGGLISIRLYGDSVFFFTTKGTWFLLQGQKILFPYVPPVKLDKDFRVQDIISNNDSVTYLCNYYSLIRWNRKTGKIIRIKPPLDTLENGQKPVFGFLNLANDGKLWFVAGFGWIGCLDVHDHISYIKMQDDPKLDYNGYYSSMFIDRSGKIWLGNNGAGVSSYDPGSKRVRNYYQSDGLMTDEICEAIPDKNGILWCASRNRFSVMDPGSEHYYNFSLAISDGITNYDNYSCLTVDGNVLVVANYHIVEFFPDRLSYKPASVNPVISALEVNGVRKFTDQSGMIRLNPDENALVFKFGSLTDKEIFPYGFVYQLEGVDDSMMKAGKNAEAIYNNLPPGKYTFRVKTMSLNGSWVSRETVLVIIIRSPFFRTAWFMALMVIVFLGSIYALYRYRIRQKERLLHLESKAQLLEKEKALVMYENLKQHLNPHFLFNSLTSLGSLIRLNSKLAGEFLDKMSKVYRYVLKNRDNELVPLSEEIRFVRLYNDLQKTRFEDALQINMSIDEEYHHRRIAPVTLQNLVENAIKHNTADPESPLVIDLFVENDNLVVRNNLQRKNFVETSNKQGLQNMMSLYEYLSDRKMVIEETASFFTVKIPLL